MMRFLVLAVVLLAVLALAAPVAAQSDVTKTVWYSRFKQVATTFNPRGFSEWESHISRNRINFVDTIPRDRSQQLLRTFVAMNEYNILFEDVQNHINTLPQSSTFNFTLSSRGPYAWLTPAEYHESIGGLILDNQQGDTLSLTNFMNTMTPAPSVAPVLDYSARRNAENTRTVLFAHALQVPFMGYGCKSSWAVVVADALSMYMQYQRSHADKARARSDPRSNLGLLASPQQLIDCATVDDYTQSVTRNPCSGNTLAAAFEYITGRNYAASVPGAAPSRGLNPVSHYHPLVSRGSFKGSSDVFQSRGYCAAEQMHSMRYYLDGSDSHSGYVDEGDLSVAIGYGVSELNIALLMNYRQTSRARGRTGPLISSVNARSRNFQLYSGGIFNNVQGSQGTIYESCSFIAPHVTVDTLADQPVLIMGYYDLKIDGTDSNYWVLRVPFGRTWGDNGIMRLAKNVSPFPNPTIGLCGLGSIVGAFLPPGYQHSAIDALPSSGLC